MEEPKAPDDRTEVEPEPDFAEEHDQTAVTEEGEDGETESPAGHSGLEPTTRPN